MQQRQLFRLAPEGVSLNAYYVHGEGWRLIGRMRRGDEPWNDTAREDYSHLTTAELEDVIAALVAGWLENT